VSLEKRKGRQLESGKSSLRSAENTIARLNKIVESSEKGKKDAIITA
jgi:hypothetical protein